MGSKDRLYNYTVGESNLVVDERYSNVGSDTLYLGDVKRAFIEEDFSIEEGDSNGTVLVENVDYEFTEKDSEYTSLEDVDVWTGINIINAAYQNSVLYITYRAVGSYIDADLIQDMLDTLSAASVPVGSIISFSGSSAPTGYLLCDGSAISRTIYDDLFTAISTTWGVGDGSATFNIPDLRGAFLRGTGSHGSSTMANTNAFAGPALGAFEDDQFQGHWHGRYTADNNANTTVTTDIYFSKNTQYEYLGNAATGINPFLNLQTVRDPITDGVNGTPRSGDETRPFSAGVKFYIKVI